MSSTPKATAENIENYFKQNILQLVEYLVRTFSCSKTETQFKLLQTMVFPSKTFTSQMIL
jgi:hypothetical protein